MELLKRNYADTIIEEDTTNKVQKFYEETINTPFLQQISRLGKCEVCVVRNAMYTCPKCEVKTCCLECSKIHKVELKCNGKRDRTKYISIGNFTTMDFMADCSLLEECKIYIENRKTDKIKKYSSFHKNTPNSLCKLKSAAAQRKINLKFLLENFSKHQNNTTFYDQKLKTIYWTIKWIFPNAGYLQFIDKNVSENDRISKILEKYLSPQIVDDIYGKKPLRFYQSRGIGNLKILLKSECIKNNKNRFYELDCKKSLKENLCGKSLIEYPCIHICYEDGIQEFDVIDSDEDVEQETKKYRSELNTLRATHKKSNEKLNNSEIEIPKKKLVIKRKTKLPQTNLLFLDENATSSDSDTDNITAS